jgi:hypothetical protein
MSKTKSFLIGLAALALAAPPALAGTITTFSTSSTSANLAATYPSWTFLGTQGSADVSGGQLRFTGTSNPTQLFLYNSTFSGAFTFDALVSETNGSGAFNVGLFIGLPGSETGMLASNGNSNTNADRIVFHPGYSGGALRVEGGGGFSNQNVGWTPASGTMADLSIASDGLGHFTVKLTDGNNSNLTYTTTFTNSALSGQALEIGLTAAGGEGSNYALFDNPSVSTFAAPEPASIVLLGAGLAALGAVRRRREKPL